MPTLFSQVLLSCVGEGREPLAPEVAALTKTIWQEAYGIDSPPDSCLRAAMFARGALIGSNVPLKRGEALADRKRSDGKRPNVSITASLHDRIAHIEDGGRTVDGSRTS